MEQVLQATTKAVPSEDTATTRQEPGPSTRDARASRTWAYGIAVAIGVLPVFMSPSLWMLPSLAMLGYLATQYGPAKRDGEVYELADAFYYLGFTLSVGSLLAALDPFNWATRPNPERIFHFFGLGMLTTLVGVVGRTMLQIFHRLPAETLEAVNQKVEDRAGELVDQLGELAEATSRIVRETLESHEQMISPRLAELVSGVAAVKEQTTALAKQAVDVGVEVDRVTRALRDAVSAYDEGAQAADNQRTRLVKAHQALYEEAKLARDEVSLVRGAVRAVNQGVANSEEVASSALATIAAEAAAARGALKALAAEAASLRLDPSDAAEGLEKFSRSIASAAATTETAISQLQQAIVGDEDTARVTQVGLARSGETDDSRRSSNPGLAPTVQQLVAQLNSFDSVVRQRADVLASEEIVQLRSLVSETLTTARRLNAALDEIADAATRKLQAIQ
jgi:hypothetical protein